MTFFDKKEEVMKIELTPYGRYLLSVGKLKPHSYRFFDDNIIYDSESGGFVEKQYNANNRIKENTPLLKGNPNVTGVETNIKKFEVPEVYAKNIRIPTLDDVVNTNNECIGTNDYKSKNASYYKVDLFKSKFLVGDMSKAYTSNNVGNIPIPQLPISVNLTASIMKSESDMFDVNVSDLQNYTFIESATFDDESYFSIMVEDPLIRIKEINSFDEKDNFIMSAFKVNNIDNTITYERLKFPKKAKKIVNNILLDDPAGEIDFTSAFSNLNEPIGPDRIDYYLGFIFDKEIPDETICNTIGELEIRNIFLDEKLPCPDYEPIEDFDIYSSRVRQGDLDVGVGPDGTEEDCD